MKKNNHWIIIFATAFVIGCACSIMMQKLVVLEKHNKYIFPYEDYTMASYGNITLYEKVVKERQEKTPSHPDYFDLSIEVGGCEDYVPSYYNAYRALRDLYDYNHFKMGEKVKRLMYGYLQLAIEKKDKRITKKDLKGFYSAFPDGEAKCHGDSSDYFSCK